MFEWAKLFPKGKMLKFDESLNSFPQEIDKKEQIQNFSWLIIKTLSPQSHWQWRLTV